MLGKVELVRFWETVLTMIFLNVILIKWFLHIFEKVNFDIGERFQLYFWAKYHFWNVKWPIRVMILINDTFCQDQNVLSSRSTFLIEPYTTKLCDASKNAKMQKKIKASTKKTP